MHFRVADREKQNKILSGTIGDSVITQPFSDSSIYFLTCILYGFFFSFFAENSATAPSFFHRFACLANALFKSLSLKSRRPDMHILTI